MTTRVQKGSTVFRPVAKARPRPAEGTATSHLSEDPQAITPSTVLPPQSSLHDHEAPAVIANTTKQGVPIVICSSAPPLKSRRPVSAPAGPSQIAVPIMVQTPLHQRVRSESSITATKKNRKVRRPATPAFDADADPGEDLDPTSVTMAALCEDTGQGRVSSKAAQILDNHLSWKKTNKDKRARMRVRMEAKKYGRNEDGDTTQVNRPEGESEQTTIVNATPGPSSVQPVPTVGDASGQGFDYSKNVSTSRYNVQVRIGPNGETIIDEESLFVDRNAEEDTTEYTHVEESDVTKFVNSATYSKRFRGSRWSAEETELFYDALSQFGENYELISYILPGRDRKACKNKFKSEDKKNPQRINYCLKKRKPYDMQTLSRMTGKDFSGPTPVIRAPVKLSFEQSRNNREGEQDPVSIGAEVVGDISSFDL